VQQVRLSATNTNNVITYPVVVTADNADRSLLPGMTVNAEIEVSRRDGVLKAPNAALRFKPAEDDTASASQSAPGRGAGGMATDLPRIAQALALKPAQQSSFDAALAQMRERMAARAAPTPSGNGGGSVLFGGGRPGGGPAGGSSRTPGTGGMDGAMRQRMQERFNQQFTAFRASLDEAQRQRWDGEVAALVSARRAPLYKLVEGKPQATIVRVGASDGSNTEISGDVREGDVVIVGTERAAQPQ
jgi:HlyD family secretion protein